MLVSHDLTFTCSFLGVPTLSCILYHGRETCSLLSAAGLQSPIIAIEPHSAVVRVGETATFRCRVYSGAQPVRLEWKVANSQRLPGNLHTVVLLNGFLK